MNAYLCWDTIGNTKPRLIRADSSFAARHIMGDRLGVPYLDIVSVRQFDRWTNER